RGKLFVERGRHVAQRAAALVAIQSRVSPRDERRRRVGFARPRNAHYEDDFGGLRPAARPRGRRPACEHPALALTQEELRPAARAAARAAGGGRAPGVAPRAGAPARPGGGPASGAGPPRAAASSTSGGGRSRLRPRRGPPSGECASTTTPRSAQRSTTPPRS